MNEKYPLALPEGTVLAGQYIVEKVLGQGGFGITYEAKDHKTGERVAVKEFFPDAMATRTEQTTVLPFSGEKGENYTYGKTCFLQEAETLAKFIGNENIVRIHSYFEENGTAYFVMDFIEGTSFDAYLKQRGGKIPYEEAAQILIPIMDALSSVHSKGIIHRDVTPDNIYITKEGVVKLLDFGAARYSLGDQSRSLDVILKHGFAPKEQYTRRGKQGPFTDIYALGATFYFALTGKRPPDSVERMDEDDLVPPSSLGVQISGAAEDAILKALSVQPADRFQSMMEFKAALLNPQQAGAVRPPLAAVGSPVSQTFFAAPDQTGISRTGTTGGPAPAPGQDTDLQDLAATMKTAGKLAGRLAGKVAGKMAEKSAETAGIMAGTAGKMAEIMAAKKAETAEKLTAKMAQREAEKAASAAEQPKTALDGTGGAEENAGEHTVGVTAGDAEGGAAGAGSTAGNNPSRRKLLIPAAAACLALVIVFMFVSNSAKDVKNVYYTDSEGYSGVYTGKWKDDQPYGEGTITWDGGNVYTGHWKNGMPNGQGTSTFASGDTYTGEWVDARIEGKGTYTWASDGRTYTGEWVDGHTEGQGTMRYGNGDTYEGAWLKGRASGWGTYNWPNGDVYVGEFKDGYPNGEGTYTFADGRVNKGQWKDGNFLG